MNGHVHGDKKAAARVLTNARFNAGFIIHRDARSDESPMKVHAVFISHL